MDNITKLVKSQISQTCDGLVTDQPQAYSYCQGQSSSSFAEQTKLSLSSINPPTNPHPPGEVYFLIAAQLNKYSQAE